MGWDGMGWDGRLVGWLVGWLVVGGGGFWGGGDWGGGDTYCTVDGGGGCLFDTVLKGDGKVGGVGDICLIRLLKGDGGMRK